MLGVSFLAQMHPLSFMVMIFQRPQEKPLWACSLHDRISTGFAERQAKVSGQMESWYTIVTLNFEISQEFAKKYILFSNKENRILSLTPGSHQFSGASCHLLTVLQGLATGSGISMESPRVLFLFHNKSPIAMMEVDGRNPATLRVLIYSPWKKINQNNGKLHH